MSKKMQVKKQPTKYDILLEDLRALMAQARGDIMRLSKRIVVVNYWKMGERIVKEGLPEESTAYRDRRRCKVFREGCGI